VPVKAGSKFEILLSQAFRPIVGETPRPGRSTRRRASRFWPDL